MYCSIDILMDKIYWEHLKTYLQKNEVDAKRYFFKMWPYNYLTDKCVFYENSGISLSIELSRVHIVHRCIDNFVIVRLFTISKHYTDECETDAAFMCSEGKCSKVSLAIPLSRNNNIYWDWKYHLLSRSSVTKNWLHDLRLYS